MITAPKQPSTYTVHPRLVASRAIAIIRWPFTNKFAAPIWLALRLYIASIWFQMSISKFRAGWLTSDPLSQLFKLIENGTMPVPLPFYREIAGAMLHAGITPYLSHGMPFLEMAAALAFASGVLVPVAAVGAILLNINIILSGMGTPAFDAPIIASQVLFLLSYRVVGAIGFERIALRVLGAALRLVRPARQTVKAS